MLKNYNVFSDPNTWATITILLLEVLFGVSMVYLWNWVVSKEFNTLLFGEPKLDVIKGTVVVMVIDVYNKLKDNTKSN